MAHHHVSLARVGHGDRVARKAAAALELGGGLDEIGHHLTKREGNEDGDEEGDEEVKSIEWLMAI